MKLKMLSRLATSTAVGAARGSQFTPALQNVAKRMYHEKVSHILSIYSSKKNWKLINKLFHNFHFPSHHDIQVIDHYENPRNVGKLDAKKKNVGTGLVGAPACGDVMKLQIEVDDDGKIIDAKFKTFGCGSAIASSSLATEWIKGKSVWKWGI